MTVDLPVADIPVISTRFIHGRIGESGCSWQTASDFQSQTQSPPLASLTSPRLTSWQLTITQCRVRLRVLSAACMADILTNTAEPSRVMPRSPHPLATACRAKCSRSVVCAALCGVRQFCLTLCCSRRVPSPGAAVDSGARSTVRAVCQRKIGGQPHPPARTPASAPVDS